MKKPRFNFEYNSQKDIFEWANNEYVRLKYPELELLFSVPNGAFYGRDKTAAFAQHAMLKATGMKKGVPDLFLPVANKEFHGLFIEMKSPTGKLSKEQKEWNEKLNAQNYLAIVCHTSTDTINAIIAYLQNK